MKLAHIAIATPFRCGLYETTRELAAAIRTLGHDARIVDPKPVAQFHPGPLDRGVPIEPLGGEFLKAADVICDHSGCDVDEIKATTCPIVYVGHGRPQSSYIGERAGKPPVLSYQYKKARENPRYKAVVTFWPSHAWTLQMLWKSVPVTIVPPCVDLEAWHPVGERHEYPPGNLIITDPWRDDIDPYPALTACWHFCRRFPAAKVHVYGRDGNGKGVGTVLAALREGGNLGEVRGWTTPLQPIYRSGDVLVTPHTIATRSIREAMACGCRVAKDIGPGDAPAIAAALLGADPRPTAERLFDPTATAKAFIAAIESF